ncbi:MAG TPA: hypothetical protein VNZ03_35880 [Terriglobales bacterium]|jgi:hypothetical protein|nr:hypothetical protein [Terriglobales bacterium]
MSDIKPLPIDLRDHLGELTGNEFKVWMYYYLLTGNFDPTSHPSNQTIEAHTGISKDTVKTCKARLRVKGWLAYTGDYKQPRLPKGRFDVPVMEVRLPWKHDWSAVVADASLAYDAITVVEKTTHGTVVENFHPEGSCSGSGYGSSSGSLSFSDTEASSDNINCKRRRNVSESKERIQAKSKPVNLEPTAKPKPTPADAKVRVAADSTPWPQDFDDWPNLKRLHWLEVHGKKQTSVAEAAWQRTDAPVVGHDEPTATATPLPRDPCFAAPQRRWTKCPGCGGALRVTKPCRDESCRCYEPPRPATPVAPQPQSSVSDLTVNRSLQSGDLADNHTSEPYKRNPQTYYDFSEINAHAQLVKFMEQGREERELSSINVDTDLALNLDNLDKL